MIILGIRFILFGGYALWHTRKDKVPIISRLLFITLIIFGIWFTWDSIDYSTWSKSHSNSYNSSSSSGSGYSSKYDKDLDDIADAFGTDRDTVDRILNGLADAMD